VLPREFSLQDVSDITASGVMETEVFVHGAMCMAISGRCLLGAYLSGRHANRGDCPQPCRLAYRIAPVEGADGSAPEWFEAVEDPQGTHLLNARDLNTLDLLPHIVATGVSALKVEGRTKSEHYVATVIGVYREALDMCLAESGRYAVKGSWREQLDRIEHRTYTTGFLGGEYQMQAVHAPKATGGYRLVGVVREVVDGGAVVEVKNPFAAGDFVQVLAGRSGTVKQDVEIRRVRDLHGRSVDRATANRIVVAECSVPLRVGDMLRRELQ
jgi:putative protease